MLSVYYQNINPPQKRETERENGSFSQKKCNFRVVLMV